MLVDEATITVCGGRGGDGIVSWRREKFIDRGGPDGGDGGKGGDVLAVADHNLDSLEKYRSQSYFKADDGEQGESKKRHGADGRDKILYFPPGTLIQDQLTGQTIVDFRMVKANDQLPVLLAKGGRGGLGNTHFTRPDRRAPDQATTGRAGEERRLVLQLNLLADVALVGLPNAGKSSLLKVLTGREGRIAAFAFSTKEPLLGVWRGQTRRLFFVDLPGLIAGAHQGKGLGDKFLHHLKRVKAIVHLIDITNDNLAQAKATIESELMQYDKRLASLPVVLCFSKSDLVTEKDVQRVMAHYPHALAISAKTGEGVDLLTNRLCQLVPFNE